MTYRSVAVLSIAILCCLSGCRKTEQTAPNVTVRVDYVNGEVSIDGRTVEPGAAVKAVFTVKTGAASACGIIFNEKNILHVDENTEAYVDLASDLKRVDLRRGTLASALRKLAALSSAEEERFRVSSPTAVAGVRGTVFFVKVEDQGSTYLCTCNGVLHLRDRQDGNARRVESAHHEAYRFSKSGDAYSSSGAPMEYHTDQMMELGAARIGETIDWTTVGK
jgi:hypothetical protein